MLRFILKRLVTMIPLLIGISFLCFLILRLSPGDFVQSLYSGDQFSDQIRQQVTHEFGLDKPWPVQYLLWLGNACRLNFGISLATRQPVAAMLWERMGNTLILSICSMIVAWGLAIPLGIISAVKRNAIIDRLCSLLAFTGISVPTFFLALMALLFAQKTGWFPVGNMHSVDVDDMDGKQRFVDLVKHLILPTLVLGIAGCAGIMRQMRGSLLDTLRDNYIIAAQARGVSAKKIVLKHAVRNAINPLITLFGFSLAGLLSGAALVENVMNWPGLGRLILESVQSKDIYMVMGAFTMGASMLMLGNLLSDILLAVTDPRIRLGK
jgi:peptide/nickel transport system permease protein